MDNHLFLMACQVLLNIRMNIDQLLEQGNQHRANHQPELAL